MSVVFVAVPAGWMVVYSVGLVKSITALKLRILQEENIDALQGHVILAGLGDSLLCDDGMPIERLRLISKYGRRRGFATGRLQPAGLRLLTMGMEKYGRAVTECEK